MRQRPAAFPKAVLLAAFSLAWHFVFLPSFVFFYFSLSLLFSLFAFLYFSSVSFSSLHFSFLYFSSLFVLFFFSLLFLFLFFPFVFLLNFCHKNHWKLCGFRTGYGQVREAFNLSLICLLWQWIIKS